MTDTGQVPGEGLPESAGGQPEVRQQSPAPGTYTFMQQNDVHPGAPAGEAPQGEEELLMPGTWGEQPPHVAQSQPHPAHPQPHPAGYPVEAYVAAQYPQPHPEPHEADGRDSGHLDYGAVRPGEPAYAAVAEQPAPQEESGPAPAAEPSTEEQPDAEAQERAQHNRRRPLHLGPPVPEQSGTVRSLSDRGPAPPRAAPQPEQQPAAAQSAAPQGPPTLGPEYLDVAGTTAAAGGSESLPGPQLGAMPPQTAPWTEQHAPQPSAPGSAQGAGGEEAHVNGHGAQDTRTGQTTPPEPTHLNGTAAPSTPAHGVPTDTADGAPGEAVDGLPGSSTPAGGTPVDTVNGAPAGGTPAGGTPAGAPVPSAAPEPAAPVEVAGPGATPSEETPVGAGQQEASVDSAAEPVSQPSAPEGVQAADTRINGVQFAAAPGAPVQQDAAPAQPEPDPEPLAADSGPEAAAPAPAQSETTAPAPGETQASPDEGPQSAPAQSDSTSPREQPVEDRPVIPSQPDGDAMAARIQQAAEQPYATPPQAAEAPAPGGPSLPEQPEAPFVETMADTPAGTTETEGPAPAEPESAPGAAPAGSDRTQATTPEPATPLDPTAVADARPESAAGAPTPPTESAIPEDRETPVGGAPEPQAPGAEGTLPAQPVPASAPISEDGPAGAVPSTEVEQPVQAAAVPEPAAADTAAEQPGQPPQFGQPEQPAPAEQPEATEPPEPRPTEHAPGYDEAEREAVHRLMRERRDIRNGFRSDPIPDDVLLRVLEAAHTAPSVGHSQPWDFVVIRSAETRRTMHELAERQRAAYAQTLPKARAKQFKELKIEAILDTPVNIVVTADPTRGGRHTLGRHTQPQMAPYSSALAVENLWLAARAEGLGVGWVSFFDEREMVRALELPEHLEVVAYLCVGYVDEFPPEPELAQAGWSKRRPLSWVVHDESYGRRALPGAAPHDLLAETLDAIRPLDAKALGEAWERQKRMTKPAGALGMLEIISAQLCGLSRQCPPPIPEPAAVAIFAGDHGVHAQGVTPWPQEVTGQMVANFLGGGAVCNAFATQVGVEVCVIDVGVGTELPSGPGLLPRKVRPGTADMTEGPALTRDEAARAVEVGIETARDLVAAGNRALLTGEMGIANTTASAALISACTGVDPSEATGRGTGINDETHSRKVEVVRRALELHQPDAEDPVGLLAAFGGLEHAAMVGLILGGASLRTPVLLDGVSAGAAALVARALAPESLAACIAGHRSAEPGHVAALTKLGLRPLVDLDLRLGEGTGALLALPLVQSAARTMHDVATFDSAGVTEKD